VVSVQLVRLIEMCLIRTHSRVPVGKLLYDIIIRLVPCIFYYFVQRPRNAQLFNQLLYFSYKFQHCCVILRELVFGTLLSYISMLTQLLVIQFKVSHVLLKSVIKIFKILKLS